MDDVAIVVLSYGEDVTCLPLLASLVRDQGILAERIVVAHNPSSSRSQPSLPQELGKLKALPMNVGYAGGMNAGYRVATTEMSPPPAFVLFLTHDVALSDGCIAALRAAMEEQPACAVAGPVLLEGDRPWSAGKRRLPNGSFVHVREASSAPAPRDAVDGSAILLRVAALSSDEPPFDERLFMYFEETDLCWRLNNRGWTVLSVPAATANSEPGGSRRPAAHSYLMVRNGLTVAARNGGPATAARHLGHALRVTWSQTPKPGGRRFGDPALREEGIKRWRGMTYGILDFARGRLGPPPPAVADGDVWISQG